MTRVALATSSFLGDLEADERLVLEPLRALGVDARPAVWDDPAEDWPAFDLVVVRSVWDYTDRREAFVAWARSVPRLANPAEVIAWNTDKRYLAELAAAGIATVPTTFLEPGDAVAVPDGAGEVVVKPTVSAGSRDTGRYAAADPGATAHAEALLAAGRTVMVQPYLEGVDSAGETALVSFAGSYSHAIRKAALLAPGAAPRDEPELSEAIAPRTPSAVEHAVADRVLAFVSERFGEPLYARVDLVPGADGEPVLIELELTEPSLFLGTDPRAPERLARAIAAAAGP